jgi:uncharacterized LabA/DUF88 family protein
MNSEDALKGFFDDERTALFIDGASLYSASRGLSFDVDYSLLLELFRDRTDLVSANYYSAILETDEYSPLKPLTDWLAYNGYTLKTKPAREFTDATGRRRVKGNMDIELAVDMLDLAPHIQHVVLFSGDSDFKSLVEAMQRRGVKVTVISTVKTQPPLAGDELRRQANRFIDLYDIIDMIKRSAPVSRRYPADLETTG